MKSAPVALAPTPTFVLAAAFKTQNSPVAFQDRPGVLRLNVGGGGFSPDTGGGEGLWLHEDRGREQKQLTL